jgi:hypothetical protein
MEEAYSEVMHEGHTDAFFKPENRGPWRPDS